VLAVGFAATGGLRRYRWASPLPVGFAATGGLRRYRPGELSAA